MKGTEIVGRFHAKHPISSKNPLTNQVSRQTAILSYEPIYHFIVNHWRSRVLHVQKSLS